MSLCAARVRAACRLAASPRSSAGADIKRVSSGPKTCHARAARHAGSCPVNCNVSGLWYSSYYQLHRERGSICHSPHRKSPHFVPLSPSTGVEQTIAQPVIPYSIRAIYATQSSTPPSPMGSSSPAQCVTTITIRSHPKYPAARRGIPLSAASVGGYWYTYYISKTAYNQGRQNGVRRRRPRH
jgi:hypothetical protein